MAARAEVLGDTDANHWSLKWESFEWTIRETEFHPKPR
jgi:hypothetical protein